MVFVFLCLTYFSWYDNLIGPSMLPQMELLYSSLRLSNISPCIYIVYTYIYTLYLLYQFVCRWIFRLLPCPDQCKQCCYEHWNACVFLNYSFLWMYAQEWDCWIIWQLYFQFFKETPYCSLQWLYQFVFLPTVQKDWFSFVFYPLKYLADIL